MNIHEQFVRACENGDYTTVARILDRYQITNPVDPKKQIKNPIDWTNQLGQTGMQLAIENEHLEVGQIDLQKSTFETKKIVCFSIQVVTLLLNRCDEQKMREAILLAIYLGHVQIVEACILHPTFKDFNDRGGFDNEESFWATPSSDDAQFAPDMTPLILAAQYNRTEIGFD